MMLLTIFSAAALALAAIGIYGLLSYSVEQSTHDIGVRLALGADRSDTLSLVALRGMRLAVIGVDLGIAAAAASMRVLSGMWYGVRSFDITSITVVVGLLGVTALLACCLPARRAMGVDPIIALRRD